MRRRWIGADAPHVRGEGLPWRAYAWAFGIVVVVTGLNHLWHGRIDEANLVMAYLFGMLPVALRGDPGAAITAAVLSVAAFDLFFVLPYHTLAVSDTQVLFTFLVMGLVGGLISTLTARLAAEIARAEKRRLDEARARQEAEAARTQAETERLRSALLSSVSHDLRTPLAGIVGAASSLLDGADALPLAQRQELAAGIIEEGQRLNRLVTNLLQATRLQAGDAALQREWTSLEDVVAPAIARLSRQLADHPLDITLPDDLPLIQADPVMLEQAFANMLENAARHTPAGTPIRLTAHTEGSSLVVDVADAGPGLPEEGQARLFEAFQRATGAGVEGAGLGLAIVRGVVETHGGTVSATNRPEGGAVFTVTLPLAEPPAPRT